MIESCIDDLTFFSPIPTATTEKNSSPSTSNENTEVAPFIRRSRSSSEESLPELIIEVDKRFDRHDDEPEEVYEKLEKTMRILYRKYTLKIDDDSYSTDSGVQRFEAQYMKRKERIMDDYYGSPEEAEKDQDVAEILAENTDASEETDTTTGDDVETPELKRRQRWSRETDIIPTKRTKY